MLVMELEEDRLSWPQAHATMVALMMKMKVMREEDHVIAT
jgi:hypothetical protein